MSISEIESLSNSLVLIGPWSTVANDFGAEIISDSQQIPWDRLGKTEVLGVSVTHLLTREFQLKWTSLLDSQPWIQLVAVIPKGYSAKALLELANTYNFAAILNDFQDQELTGALVAALEKSRTWAQDFKFESLMKEQNDNMRRLHKDLEERIDKRTRSLTDARRRLFSTNTRIESLRKALTAVHSAGSTEEIERNLNDALASGIGTTWIRMCSAPEDETFANETAELPFTRFQAALFRNEVQIGSLFFMREVNRPFLREEKQLLTKVAEAASLALERLHKLAETESIRKQWETTFKAIQDPLIMIDENYNILQSNQETLATNRKCYEVLFKRSSPCDHCQLGSQFTTASAEKNFEVHSQMLAQASSESKTYLNIYHDVSEKLRMEKQIIEKSKMAELGTIGSSIAHELNNPIGGILNFSQLIKMDLEKESPYYQDIEAIEQGALRCKEIVENLLIFVRNPQLDRTSLIDLRELIQRALKIANLEARAKKIDLSSAALAEPVMIIGQMNVLVQGLVLVLQLAMEGLAQHKNAHIKIDVLNSAGSEKVEIILTQEPQIEVPQTAFRNSAIAMLSRILQDNNGRVEFAAGPEAGFLAKISLPRPPQRS